MYAFLTPLLLLLTLLVSGCSTTILTVENSLNKPNAPEALKYLNEIEPTPKDRFATIFKPTVTLYDFNVSSTIIDKALEKGADISAKDKNDKTLLDYAKAKKDKELILYLIGKDFNLTLDDGLFTYAYENNASDLASQLFAIHYPYSAKTSLLERSLKEGNYTWALFLLSHGANINSDPTLLRYAIDNNNTMLANFLLDNGYNVLNDASLLSYVVKNKNLPFLTYLLAAGFDVNADPTLMSYVIKMEDYPLADYLLANGANLNNDPSLLTYAVSQQNFKMIKYLVSKGMRMPFATNELMSALKNNRFEFAGLLMDMGATVDNGMSPLTYAAFLHNKDALIFMLSRSFDVNAYDKNGRTALMYVADNNDLVDFLIRQKANVNAKDSQGRTVLMYAINDFSVIKKLITNGARIDVKDSHHRTLLMYAVSVNNFNLITFLVENRFPLNEEDRDGNRALAYSTDMKTTKYLMKYNARY